MKHFNFRGHNLKSLPRGGSQTYDLVSGGPANRVPWPLGLTDGGCSWGSVVPCTPSRWPSRAAAHALKGRVRSSLADHPLQSSGELGSEECGCYSSLAFLRYLLAVPHPWAWIEQVHAWLTTMILCLFVKGQNMRLPNKI